LTGPRISNPPGTVNLELPPPCKSGKATLILKVDLEETVKIRMWSFNDVYQWNRESLMR
jgi:hypothetical protein